MAGRPTAMGQATLEAIGLAALVAAVLLTLAALTGGVPADAVAGAVGRIVGRQHPTHGDRWALSSPTWGPVIRRYAPRLVLERDRYGTDFATPVDFASCRLAVCAAFGRSRPVVFVHLTRRPGAAYIAYWFYYPDSRTDHLPIDALRGYHSDDWEGMIVRLDAHGATARVTAHVGLTGQRPWWDPDPGWRQVQPHPIVYRASGSHGNGFEPTDIDLAGDAWNGTLGTVTNLALDPADEASRQRRRFDPGATPPWIKRLWHDPEVIATSDTGQRGAGAEAAAAWAAVHGVAVRLVEPGHR